MPQNSEERAPSDGFCVELSPEGIAEGLKNEAIAISSWPPARWEHGESPGPTVENSVSAVENQAPSLHPLAPTPPPFDPYRPSPIRPEPIIPSATVLKRHGLVDAMIRAIESGQLVFEPDFDSHGLITEISLVPASPGRPGEIVITVNPDNDDDLGHARMLDEGCPHHDDPPLP